ncbi:MAG: hypothetical protein U1F76_31255 [Candidatus Competibacteraceae bacterium]
MEKRIDLNASDLSQQHFWNTTRLRYIERSSRPFWRRIYVLDMEV